MLIFLARPLTLFVLLALALPALLSLVAGFVCIPVQIFHGGEALQIGAASFDPIDQGDNFIR